MLWTAYATKTSPLFIFGLGYRIRYYNQLSLTTGTVKREKWSRNYSYKNDPRKKFISKLVDSMRWNNILPHRNVTSLSTVSSCRSIGGTRNKRLLHTMSGFITGLSTRFQCKCSHLCITIGDAGNSKFCIAHLRLNYIHDNYLLVIRIKFNANQFTKTACLSSGLYHLSEKLCMPFTDCGFQTGRNRKHFTMS